MPYQIRGNLLHNVKDQYTGEHLTFKLTTVNAWGEAITDSDVDNVLYRKFTDLPGQYWELINKPFANIRWWGVAEDGTTDDSRKIERAGMDCIKAGWPELKFWKRKYKINTGVFLESRDKAKTPYFTLNLTGSGASYDPYLGGCTEFIVDGQTFGINLQLGKGCTVKNIFGRGANTGVLSYGMREIINPATNWATNGVRDNPNSPHCLFGVDLAGTSAYSMEDRYASITDKYTYNISGSTDINFINCKAAGFVVSACISPHFYPQNAENVHFDRCWFDGCETAISTGNSQTRCCYVTKFTCWRAKKVIDSALYGGGGALPEITGANIANCKYLYSMPANQDAYAIATNVKTEYLFSLGGCLSAPMGQMFFTNCMLDILGAVHESETIEGVVYPIMIPQNSCVGQAEKITFNGGRLIHYGPPSYPLTFNTAYPVSFNGTKLSTSIYNADAKYADVMTFEGAYYDRSENVKSFDRDTWTNTDTGPKVTNPEFRIDILNRPISRHYKGKTKHEVAGQTVTVSLDPVNHTWQFINSILAKAASPGVIYATIDGLANDMGVTKRFAAGAVIASNPTTGVVVVRGIPYGMTNGQSLNVGLVSDMHFKSYLCGNTTSGSATITNVLREGFAVSPLRAGDPIYHEAFPHGTVVINATTADGNGVITCSNAASATTKLCFTTCPPFRTETWADSWIESGNTYKIGLKKGDIVWNDRRNPANNHIEKWVATSDGITNVAGYEMNFQTYFIDAIPT